MNDRGFFYTLSALLLIIPLLLFVAYYATMEDTKTQDTLAKVRCDELHYFVEDVRTDIGRAMTIFGRRGAIYAIDHVVESNRHLEGYTFNCTQSCRLNCSKFEFARNGSTAAVAELMVCGTLYGGEVGYMTNHTLSEWLNRIESIGSEMHFNTIFEITNIDIVQHDAWGFTTYVNISFRVEDESGMCFFDGQEMASDPVTSLIGLEDPLYALMTDSKLIKIIDNCTPVVRPRQIAGCSTHTDPGSGSSTGNVILHSTIKSNHGGLNTYCLATPSHIISHQILVLDIGFGSCNQYDEKVCFNASHPHSFAGVINYGPNAPESFADKCNLTIPWITGTGDIDDIWPRAPPRSNIDCGEADISAGGCIQIVNDPSCGSNIVFVGTSADRINTTCYRLSNVSHYGPHTDGPSFFDRLEGRLALSGEYMNLSLLHFNNSLIGIETLVDTYRLSARGIEPKHNATWVDYLYWADVYGCEVEGSCEDENYYFRLDDAHAMMYNLDTHCLEVEGCIIP